MMRPGLFQHSREDDLMIQCRVIVVSTKPDRSATKNEILIETEINNDVRYLH